MKSKVYKTAFAAWISLATIGIANAQTVAPDAGTNAYAKTVTNTVNINNNSEARNQEKQTQEGDIIKKSKTFTKSYPIDANDVIQIDNSYGKIDVTTWNKNEVKVDIAIQASANDEADAQKILDQTNINSDKSGNVASFKTEINQGSSWWGTLTQHGKAKTHKVEINYTVYMPAKTALTLTNKYGGINLPDLDGKLNIKSSYGGLAAKSLTNADNVFLISYGGANIGSITGGQVKVSYGSLDLGEADKLDATISYSPIKITKLISTGNIDLKYGSLQISEVGKGLKTLNVNSSYSPVKLGPLGGLNTDFDVTTHYGEFSYNNNVSVTSKTPDNEHGYTSTKNYKGHIGKGGNDRVITIKSSYGGVKFD